MNYEEFDQEFGDEEFIEFIKEQARNFDPGGDLNYEINQQNYSKMLIVFCLLKRISNPKYDLIHEIEMEPRFKKACVVADFSGLSLRDKSKADFARICELSDDIGIDAQLDGTLHIEILIKDTFTKKSNYSG